MEQERTLGVAVCPMCGKRFEKKCIVQIFCSEACKDKAWAQGCEIVDYALGEEEPKGVYKCVTCGKYFKPFAPDNNQKYCSEACRTKGNRESKRKWMRNEAQKNRERKPAKKKRDEGITWAEIRAVLAEFGISNYHEAVRIAERRRMERDVAAQKAGDGA